MLCDHWSRYGDQTCCDVAESKDGGSKHGWDEANTRKIDSVERRGDSKFGHGHKEWNHGDVVREAQQQQRSQSREEVARGKATPGTQGEIDEDADNVSSNL